MNKNAIIVVLVLILAGAGYWFYTDYQKEAASDQRLMEGSTAVDPNSVASTNEETRDAAMAGTWKSTEDAKFTREFKADGTVTDRYEGDASATEVGTWTVVDPVAEDEFIDVPLANLAGMTVMKISFDEGDYYFTINTLTESSLTMTYLGGRGNVLMFTKVN